MKQFSIMRWGILAGFLVCLAPTASRAAATSEHVVEGSLPTIAESGQSLGPGNAQGLPPTTEQKAEGTAPLASRAEQMPLESAVSDTSAASTLPQTASPLPFMGVRGVASPALAQSILLVGSRRSL